MKTMNQIETIHKAFLLCNGVATDSRNYSKEAMFFALKGERFNGNKYVKEVLAGGASFAVADDVTLKDTKDVFVVSDVLKTLQELALYHRRYLGLPIIAITGTNGKTTTKELVSEVLSKKYKVKATSGNFNNHIGVPLTLLSMDKDVELGVVEMGANHVGEIGFLCGIAEPNYGLITNVGKAHLEGFGSFEGVKTAKGELYSYLKKVDGKVFINSDNEHLMKMAKGLGTLVQYGISSGELKGKVMHNNPCIAIQWIKDGYGCNNLQTNLIGEYNLENILSAICIGIEFGVLPDDVNKALEEYQPTNNRSQFIKSGANRIIMDAYNANPSSMQVALENFSKVEGSNKVVILGGMKELGDDSFLEHQKLINTLSRMKFQMALLVGDEFKGLMPKKDMMTECYANSEEVIEHLKSNPLSNAYILIKGSRSNQLEQLLEFL